MIFGFSLYRLLITDSFRQKTKGGVPLVFSGLAPELAFIIIYFIFVRNIANILFFVLNRLFA